MGLLNRKTLLQREELKIEKLFLSNDEFIYVRQMTGHERDTFERSILHEKQDKKGQVTFERALGDFRAKLAVVTVCDEKGDLLLTPNDYMTLSKNMSAFRLEKIVNVAQRLNMITEEDKEALVKNSVADQVGNSNSVSVES